MTRRESENVGNVSAGQFAPIKRRFEKGASLRWQHVHPRFFFRPKKNACAQLIGLHESFHEGDLVDAGLEEVTGEGSQRLLTEVAAAVKIVAAWEIAFREMTLVNGLATCKTARRGPNGARIKGIQQHCV
jgi:hypothetical protein